MRRIVRRARVADDRCKELRRRATIAYATPLAFPRLRRDDTRVRVQTLQETIR